MKDLCIVTCGKRKIWDIDVEAGPTAAKNVYVGPLSKKAKEYAEKYYSENWMILSAKYGFLNPTDIIPEDYDYCFNIKKSKKISIDELEIQVLNKNLKEYNKIIVLGGKFYTDMILNLFPDNEIITLLKECKGIGYMLKKD